MRVAGLPARASLVEPGPLGDSGPLRIEPSPERRPGPGELRLAVTACGICRTDLQLCTGDLVARRLPVVPGHQIVGIVDAVGAGVDESWIGSRRGVAWLASSCGDCRFCTAGRENLCEAARFTGWDVDGGFAEHALAAAAFTFELPGVFDDVSAASMLCGGAIGYRCLRVAEVVGGERLGLFGYGASARYVAQLALARGCEVFVVTRSVAEQAAARSMGVDWAGGYGERPPVELDAAITFAPAGAVVVEALSRLRRGGIVAINAIHLDSMPSFPYEQLWWERQLRSVANVTRADVRDFLAEAAAGGFRAEVTRYRLSEVNAALADLAAGRVGGSLVLDLATAPSDT